MNTPKWKAFKKSTKLAFVKDGSLIIFQFLSTPSLGHLNFLNNKLKEILSKCTKKYIPTKIIKEESFNTLKPKDLVLSKRYLSLYNRINRLLSKKMKQYILDNPGHGL